MHDGNNITASFDKAATTYDQHSQIQARIAKTLSDLIKQTSQIAINEPLAGHPPQILELGCGTGLLSSELLKDHPQSQLTITDISSAMLSLAKTRLNANNTHQQIHKPQFQILNAENLITDDCYDLITANMVIHWFEDLPKALSNIRSNLKKGAEFYYSTIGPDCFPEWSEALKQNNLPSGIRTPSALPLPLKEEHITIPYGSALEFLKNLKLTGAHNPQKGYTPLTPGQLSAAMETLNKNHKGNITWHIHYGRLSR